jgi:ribosome-associated GTPase EngA
VESVKQHADAYEFYSLGFPDVVLISGLTGDGVGELVELLTAQLDWSRWPEATPAYFKWRYYQGPRPEEAAGAGPDAAEQARIAAAIAAHETSLAQWDEEEEGPGSGTAEGQGLGDEEQPQGIEHEPGAIAEVEEKRISDEGEAGVVPAPGPRPTAHGPDEDYPFAFADAAAPRFVPDESWRDQPVRLVLVGRQNAGKSSLTNALLGEQRALVNPLPGTTRDPLYAEFERAGARFEILDTAGMKRVTRMKEDVDFYSLVRAEKSLRYSQVAVLMVDITQGVTEQDKRIASLIADDLKAVVIVASKADLIETPAGSDRKLAEGLWLDYLRRELDELSWAEVVFTSTVRPRGLDEVCQAALRARANYHKRIDNTALRQVLQEAIALNPPPVVKNREVRFFDFRQIGNCPPAILIEVNDKRLLRTSYKRFLHNTLRKHFDFTGTHLNLVWYTKARKKK